MHGKSLLCNISNLPADSGWPFDVARAPNHVSPLDFRTTYTLKTSGTDLVTHGPKKKGGP
jgi:hypothetical protein